MLIPKSLFPVLLFCTFLFFSSTIFTSCENYPRNKTYAHVPEIRIRQGEKLATKHCGSCHALPDPSLLDVKSWEDGVLPHMGPYLGIFKHNYRYYPSSAQDPFLVKNYFPSTPLLTSGEWQNIIDYYVSTSPDSLQKKSEGHGIKNDIPFFQVQIPDFQYENPAISFVKIDSTSTPHQIILADIIKQQILRFNNKLELKDSITSVGNIVDMEFSGGKIIACDIGVLNPTNGKFGRGLQVGTDSLQKFEIDSVPLFDKLARPVQFDAADLNVDGRRDYLVCEFGHLTGALSWMENTGNDKFTPHELTAQPGAIKAHVQDYNKDGLPDIWILFSQGKEGIVLFTNKGNGQFGQSELLSFPAVYGSTYFELCDFNNDGHQDIVYTCGDNADYSPVLKPYHGVYIFMNNGHNHFKEKYFFPINGCFKAIPRDFDNDGDLDIASIAFFADYGRKPEEGFVYLENMGNFHFQPYSFPESLLGRWLTMDVGDFDADGKVDIVLGNFSIRPSLIPPLKNWKKGPAFIFLKNITPDR